MDNKDHRLVGLLGRNARMTNRELASKVGLSPSSCLKRVRKLEENGVILGYRAIVAATGPGTMIEGWAGIRLEDPSPVSISKLLSLIRETEIIVEAHKISGRFDYALRFISNTMDDWRAFHDTLQGIGCGSHVQVSILVGQIK